MGQCYGKGVPVSREEELVREKRQTPVHQKTPARPSSSVHGNAWPSPFPSPSPLPAGVTPSPARSTPQRIFRWPFPPPSPAKHIRSSIAKRQGRRKPTASPIPEDGGAADASINGGEHDRQLDKTFGYGRNFGALYELGKEVGRGHFGHTCSARARKGELKGQPVAVKIISKAKVIFFRVFDLKVMGSNFLRGFQMTTAISIEDVRREVKILKALSGHNNLVRFYDACEDALNVYIIMEYVVFFFLGLPFV